jgi:inosine/xanthosine triphosphate pyrophosphatase family protein
MSAAPTTDAPFASDAKPMLVLCSSNGIKLGMYKKILPQDLLNSVETVKLPKDVIREMQGASEEVTMAKLLAYFEKFGKKYPPGSVFWIDDTIVETSGPHNRKVAGFPGAGTTYLFPQEDDPLGTKRYKGRLEILQLDGVPVSYTCSIGLIRTDSVSEFHEGTVVGSFVPLPEEKKDTPKNIDPQFLPDGEEQTLDDKDDQHPRRLAVMEVMAKSKLITELLVARDC